MIGRRRDCLRLMLCAALVVAAGGCAQRWRFAPPGQLAVVRAGSAETSSSVPDDQVRPASWQALSDREPGSRDTGTDAGARADAAPAANKGVGSLCSRTDTGSSTISPEQRLPTPLFGNREASWPPAGPVSIERLPPVEPLGDAFFDATISEAVEDQRLDCQWMPGPFERPYRVFRRGESAFVAWTGCAHSRLPEGLTALRWKALRDQRHYYSWLTTRDFLLGIAGSSLLANTSMDQDFRDWYQDDVRTSGGDKVADFWKGFGEGQYVIPSMVGIGLTGWLLEDYPVGDVAGHYGWHTTRAYLVGVPSAVFWQWALGSSRPGEKWYESSWRPFEDKNAVSGHAFVGAVPFITAANMCEDPYAAGCFYFMSLLPGWSRVNDDSHYLSQTVLGWWIAYLACRSVEQTETQCGGRRFQIAPMCGADTVGATAVWAF